MAKRNEPPVVNFTIASYLRLWPTFFSLLASPPFLRPLSQLEPREMVIPLAIRKTYPAPRSRSTRASERSALGKSSLSSKPVKIFLPPAFIRSIFRGFVQGQGGGLAVPWTVVPGPRKWRETVRYQRLNFTDGPLFPVEFPRSPNQVPLSASFSMGLDESLFP